MAQIRIRVGAAIDASLDQVFAKVTTLARKASAVVAREAKAGADAQTKAYGQALAALEKANAKELAAAEKTAAKEQALADRAAQKKVEAAKRAFDAKLRVSQRAADAEERDIMRVAAAAEKAEQRKAEAAEKAARRSREAFARGVAGGAYSQFGRIARGAGGIFGSIARGAGVNFDIGSLVSRGVEAESRAADLANSAYQPGEKGAAGVMQSPTALLQEARGVAKATGYDTNSALEGLQAFVGKTGDLETARAIMGDLAKLSRATGTALNDMVSASADVSTALGDIPNKAGVVNAVMKSIAGQGKLGAVEISDLAKEMAKVASAAGSFTGDKAQTLAVLGAITQEARQRGGAASAAQAATSTAAFARDLAKERNTNAFKAVGIDVFADKGHTALKGPEEIITQALSKTGGDLSKLAKLFPNAMSMRSVKGFANIYNEAGGGSKGLAAVEAEFDKLKRIAMGQGAIEQQFQNAMDTTAVKAQTFQTNLEEIAQSMAQRVLPELEKLAPKALALADAFANVISYAAENPFKAASIALAASITKAGIEMTIKNGIESIFKSAGSGSGIVGGAGGALGKGLMIAAAAVTITQVGELIIDKIANDASKGHDRALNQDAEATNALSAAHAAERTGTATEEQKKMIETQVSAIQQRIAVAKNEQGIGSFLSSPFRYAFGDTTIAGRTAALDDANKLPALEHQLAELKAEMAKISGGTIKVQVTNMPTGTGVDPKGRTGPT